MPASPWESNPNRYLVHGSVLRPRDPAHDCEQSISSIWHHASSFIHRVRIPSMVEWGIIHVLAMIVQGKEAIVNKTKPLYIGTYGKVLGPGAKDPRSAKLNELYDTFYDNANPFPPFHSRLLVQHAWNLGWAGVFAIVAPAFIASPLWCRFTFVWCLVPYLLDVGYWLAVDVPGLGGPAAEAQTYIVSVGLICIGHGINERWKDGGSSAPGDAEKYLMYVVPGLLIVLGLVSKVGHMLGLHPFGFLIREDLAVLGK